MSVHVRRTETRNRPPVSCEPCRSRKLKCNRDLPCDACVRRKKSSLCHYANNASRGRPASSMPRDLKDRLENLESLVSSVISGDSGVQLQTERTDDTMSDNVKSLTQDFRGYDSLARLNSVSGGEGKRESVPPPETLHLQETGDGQANYVDPSHWQAILENIKEVQDHLSVLNNDASEREPFLAPNRTNPDPSLIFSSNPTVDLPEVLNSLPTQPICERLLSWYFNSRYMVLGIVHPDKFQKEYEAFCESPSTMPIPWIALLFSILSIAAIIRQISSPSDLSEPLPSPRTLQRSAAQCLALGRYATANAHALEAFLLHLQSCFLSHDHHPVDLWFEMGTIIRLAFRMAYHRDPSNLTAISTFDGEMRRRVWLNILQIDALMSYQLGFPSMISAEYCDTQTPRNLEHSDLFMSMTILPPARPLSENTPVRYTVVKNSIMAVFKKVVAHTQSLTAPAYDRTIALDIEMKQVYNDIPETLKGRNINRSFMDPPNLIWERCTIELLYLKGLVVLHRRYISYEAKSSIFAPSQRICVDAALDILTRLADIHNACGPGGRLYEEKWMFGSIPIHDFLLAAMVVCLDLSVYMRFGMTDSIEGNAHQELAAKEYQALQTSLQIWTSSGSKFPEARMAALAIDLMITKVTEKDVEPTPTDITSSTDTPLAVESELPYANTMAQMIDGSEDIDWGLLDQYFQNLA